MSRKIFTEQACAQVSLVGGLMLLSFLIYNVVTPPRSYSWDLGFEKCGYDSVNKMYVRETTGRFNGIYRFRVWPETPENTTVMVQLYAIHNKNYPRAIWTYRNGVFLYGGQPIGSQIEGEWGLNDHYAWRALSESREAIIHIRIDFMRSEPWSLGPKTEIPYTMNPLLITLIGLLLLGPILAILDKASYKLDRRKRRKTIAAN